MLKGIDVAHHQNKIDWGKVKSDGIQFAILRLGVGSDIASQTDSKVFENAKMCESLNIPYGLYIYSYALNKQDVLSEVQHTLRVAKQLNPEMGIWFDMEDADGYKEKHGLYPRRNREKLTDFCIIFLQKMKEAGYDNVGVYASADYFKNVLYLDQIRKNGKIWLAHWGIKEPSINCDLWQYSSSGRVQGIAGRVDMDYYYGTTNSSSDTDAYYPRYTGSSTRIDEVLKEIGLPADCYGNWKNRYPVAKINGMSNYVGSASQNLELVALAKQGRLLKL